jgi:hypothetical protein
MYMSHISIHATCLTHPIFVEFIAVIIFVYKYKYEATCKCRIISAFVCSGIILSTLFSNTFSLYSPLSV